MDDGFGVLAVRRKRSLARRGEFHAARRDGPGPGIVIVEFDRNHADDLVVFDIDKDRTAIGHITSAFCAIGKVSAPSPADALGHHGGLGKPVGEPVITVHLEFEILERIDLVEPVDWRHQQSSGKLGCLEGHADVGVGMDARSGTYLAVLEYIVATDTVIPGLDLCREVLFFQPLFTRIAKIAVRGLRMQVKSVPAGTLPRRQGLHYFKVDKTIGSDRTDYWRECEQERGIRIGIQEGQMVEFEGYQPTLYVILKERP